MAPAAWPLGVSAQPQELLKEQYSALEETRADLVALYFTAEPSSASWVSCPLSTTRRSSAPNTRRSRARRWSSCDACARARSSKRTTCATARPSCTGCWRTRKRISVRVREGKTYHVLESVERFREGVGRMLTEVQRIKSEGDYDAARLLFDTYGVHFDPELRNEIVARVDRLNLPSYTGFVMPTLTPVTDGSGAITDVGICTARILRSRCWSTGGASAVVASVDGAPWCDEQARAEVLVGSARHANASAMWG